MVRRARVEPQLLIPRARRSGDWHCTYFAPPCRTDHEGDITFADEMGAAAALDVFSLLGASVNLSLIHRPVT